MEKICQKSKKRIMNLRLFLCIGWCIIATSCDMLICRTVTPDFKYEWTSGRFKDGYNSHIDEKLNTFGYFVPYSEDFGYVQFLYILYNDGSYYEVGLNGNFIYLRHKQNLDLSAYCSHSRKKPYLYSGGFYTLKGDTIVMDKYMTIEKGRPMCLHKVYWKIVDKNHIRHFKTQYFSLAEGTSKIRTYNVLYEFIPTATVPPAGNVDIKLDRNMWYDENEWKEWMKKMGR